MDHQTGPTSQRTGSGRTEAPHGGGTTPVPNGLLDTAMPRLRDTELRVLLVVVRQTLGWQGDSDPARRKELDWLTQSQLMRRTGRASGAVARAVDALVRGDLIEVLDQAGAPLRTPAERRRHLGKLFFRLSPAVGPVGAGTSKTGTSKSEQAKAHTTKESKYKNISEASWIVDKPVENPLAENVCEIRGNGWSRAGTGPWNRDVRRRGGGPPKAAAKRTMATP